ALAGHVELELEGRFVVVEVEAGATRALEGLDLAHEDAVHERTRPLGRRRPVGGHLGRAGVSGREARAPRIEEGILDATADETLVSCQLGLGQELLHCPSPYA